MVNKTRKELTNAVLAALSSYNRLQALRAELEEVEQIYREKSNMAASLLSRASVKFVITKDYVITPQYHQVQPGTSKPFFDLVYQKRDDNVLFIPDDDKE